MFLDCSTSSGEGQETLVIGLWILENVVPDFAMSPLLAMVQAGP